SPAAIAVTLVRDMPSAGASNTTCRDGFAPGTPYVSAAGAGSVAGSTANVCFWARKIDAPITPPFCPAPAPIGTPSMGAAAAGASLPARPSNTCRASTFGPGTSHEYSPTSARVARHEPNLMVGSVSHSVLAVMARRTGAISGDSFTAWMASADPPTVALA